MSRILNMNTFFTSTPHKFNLSLATLQTTMKAVLLIINMQITTKVKGNIEAESHYSEPPSQKLPGLLQLTWEGGGLLASGKLGPLFITPYPRSWTFNNHYLRNSTNQEPRTRISRERSITHLHRYSQLSFLCFSLIRTRRTCVHKTYTVRNK